MSILVSLSQEFADAESIAEKKGLLAQIEAQCRELSAGLDLCTTVEGWAMYEDEEVTIRLLWDTGRNAWQLHVADAVAIINPGSGLAKSIIERLK